MDKIEIPIVDEKDVVSEEEIIVGKLEKEKGKEKGKVGVIFVVHEHQATHLHWDLRLEMGGVLKSWAVPKEPILEKGVKRLAIQVDDHPLDYASFEGTIPEGMYGAGTVKIWDTGEFILEDQSPSRILFELKGKRLIGKYILTRFKNNWLFFKR